MSIESFILLDNISTEASVGNFTYGEKNKGAGFGRRSDGLHTIVYIVNAFTGTVKIQGTLELYPADTDWIDLDTLDLGSDSTIATENTAYSANITGNFVWLRAAHCIQDGTVTVRYNY
jgi:hypothetical protein